MNNPLVSIVTPCYNGEKYLGRFLNSVLNQTYQNIELILINDGSTDSTQKIIDEFKPVFEQKNISFITEYQANAGQASALNRGLKLFKGDYLTCVDSDDELMPQFIEKKLEHMLKNSECAFCYGKAIAVDADNPEIVLNVVEQRTEKADFFEDIIFVRNVFFSGYMFRTDVFDEIIPGREIYSGQGGQNAQLLLPFAWYYGEPDYVADSVYKYFFHNDSHSHSQNTGKKIINQWNNYQRILLATIKNINDSKAENYIPVINKHFARLKFGNAVDTKNAELIKKYYKELRQNKVASIKDLLLCFKYTNKISRKIFKVGK